MDSQKILIIDDEAPIRHALRDILEYENYYISEAESAMEALSILQNEKFNVIISDIKMPNMDGIELLSKIQEICETPVIMITDTAISIQPLKQ